MGKRLWWLVWAGAVLVVLLVTVWPPSALVSHPHWDRVTWIPFADGRHAPWQLPANVLLFLPFGYAGARALGCTRGRLILVLSLGAVLTLSVETIQLFSHGRFPSVTDLGANLVGAALGADLARRVSGRVRPDPEAKNEIRAATDRERSEVTLDDQK